MESKPQEERMPRKLVATRPRDVKAILMLKGIRQVDLIRKYQIHPSALSLVLKGKRKTLHIRKAIAAELGINFSDLWGHQLRT